MLSNKLQWLAVIAGLVSCPLSAQWFEKNYVFASGAYSDVDVDYGSEGNAGFTLGFGTEIHRQWYAEVGYSQFASDFSALSADQISNATQGLDAGNDASGLYLGFLGKASGQTGELFYRLGIMGLDYQSQALRFDGDCGGGTEQALTTVGGDNVVVCDKDDSDIAGMIGVGFDTYLGFNSQIRLSFDHIRASDSISINTIQIGYRYSF